MRNWNVAFLFFDIILNAIIATAHALSAGASAADVSAGDELFQKTFPKTKMLQKKCEIFHEIFENQGCFTKNLQIFHEMFHNYLCSIWKLDNLKIIYQGATQSLLGKSERF